MIKETKIALKRGKFAVFNEYIFFKIQGNVCTLIYFINEKCVLVIKLIYDNIYQARVI